MSQRTGRSKLLSKVLRHQPELAEVELDDAGWVDVDALVAGLARRRSPVTRAEVLDVATPRPGEKQRFELSPDGRRIRARYGHSVPVRLGYAPATPPPTLYHGTASDRVRTISERGVRPMGRQLVHLSADVDTARSVGARHGYPVVLPVDAAAMAAAGHVFHALPGGVWVTAEVPPEHVGAPVT